jgi:hypothetical protein
MSVSLCSSRDPVAEAKKWLQQQPALSKASCLAVIGYGAGYHIEELQKIFSQKIVVFECREELIPSAQLQSNIQVVNFSADQVPQLVQIWQTQVDFVLEFRPCWGMHRPEFRSLADALIGNDIKSMALEKFKNADAKWHAHLNLMMEIIR